MKRKRFTVVEKVGSSDRIKMLRISKSEFKSKRRKFNNNESYTLKLSI